MICNVIPVVGSEPHLLTIIVYNAAELRIRIEFSIHADEKLLIAVGIFGKSVYIIHELTEHHAV